MFKLGYISLNTKWIENNLTLNIVTVSISRVVNLKKTKKVMKTFGLNAILAHLLLIHSSLFLTKIPVRRPPLKISRENGSFIFEKMFF